tara:strand:+ start:1611 stop:3902 length:2292 start_codon:yes stop_codon:yes gene_type:complete
MTDKDEQEQKHGYFTRSRKDMKLEIKPQKVKIPVSSTLPKRVHAIKTNETDNKKELKVEGIRKKIHIDKNQSDLSNVIGELFVAGLVEESNKLLKKKQRNEKRNESVVNNDSFDSDESDEEYDFPKIEGLPKDIDYTEEEHRYIDNLSLIDKNRFIEQEKKLLDLKKNTVPIRFKILQLKNLSDMCKQNIIAKLDHFYRLDTTDNEYHKLSVWVDCLDSMPFDNYISLPVSINSTYNEIALFLSNTKNILNDAVYGHNEAKDKIIMTLSKQISNPNGEGVCIGIQGPMGNGKTTLVKEGICKAVNRPFGFIALGGMQDSSYMLGHDYTYEGSKPGKIVELLCDCKCMNPVIYFDELDKISKCPKGEEIENFLCHLTDTSQNTEFHDKYLSRVKIDVSKIIYIFSYNDPTKINPILLDRLYKIKTEGFDHTKKLNISKEYLLPRLYKDYNMDDSVMSINDDAIKLIIEKYAESEEGVRNLKRCLDTIISKVNVLRFLNPDSKNKDSINPLNIKDEAEIKKVTVDEPEPNTSIDNTKDISVVSDSSTTESNVVKDIESELDANADKKDDTVVECLKCSLSIEEVSPFNHEIISDTPPSKDKETNDRLCDNDGKGSDINQQLNDVFISKDNILIDPSTDQEDKKLSTINEEMIVESNVDKNDKDLSTINEEMTVESNVDKNDNKLNINLDISENIIDKNINDISIKKSDSNKPADILYKEKILSNKDIIDLKVKDFKLPFIVTTNNIDLFLKSENKMNESLTHLYL